MRLNALGFDTAHSHIRSGNATVIGDTGDADRLRALGFRVTWTCPVHQPVDQPARTAEAGTYCGGYRTASAHLARLTEVARKFPALTSVVDYGDSWLKVRGRGGRDLKAICITKKKAGDCALRPDSPKPRFVFMAQVHAREIASGEVAQRYIDLLTTGYGGNAEVTAILDITEVWVIPVANPDGVDIVSSGGNYPRLQRKNANNTKGNCGVPDNGIDLNRNSTFMWGVGDGSSPAPCDQDYRGTAAGSEPEVRSMQRLFRQLFPDQRGPNLSDPAPATTRGTMITMHSYGNMIIVPWGFNGQNSPNNTALRALGRKFAAFNGYVIGTGAQAVGYNASGVTDDFTYGALEVASFTFEIGPQSGSCGGFFPKWSCVDSMLWPKNKGALLAAAKAAKAPCKQ